jgi:hypothetical protein
MASLKTEKQIDTHANAPAAWRMAAEFSYSAAIHLFKSGDPLHLVPAAYLGHHALESLLKAALIHGGYTITNQRPGMSTAWGHSLVSLANQLDESVGGCRHVQEAKSGLQIFDDYFEQARYPIDLDLGDFEPIDAEKGKLLTQLWDDLKPFAPLATKGPAC